MSVRCRVCGRDNADGAQFCANPACQAYLGWEGDSRGQARAGAQSQAGPPAPVGGQAQAGGRPAGGQPAGSGWPGTTGGFSGGTAPVSPGPPSGAVPATGDGEQRIGVRATLADAVVTVDPGATATTTLSVYNAGTQVEGFEIRVSGPAATWTAPEPPELSVFPEQTGTVTLRFAPPRSPSCPAGHAWYVVRLDSTVHPGLTVTANGVGEVAPFHEVAAELVPVNTSGRGATMHRVAIDNRGNVVERARLSAADDEGAFRMELAHTSVELPPGRLNVPLKVRPPRRWFGRARSVPIHATVAVESGGAPLRVDGTRQVVPIFPHWFPIAALVTVLLLGGGGAALALAGGGGPNGGGGDGSPSPTASVQPTTKPSPSITTTASPSQSKSTSPTSSPSTPVDPLDRIVPADCLRYDPAKLKIYNAGTIGWRLVETLPNGQESWMLLLDDQADATAALAVARRATNFCFIGRGNSRPDRSAYIVEYWKGRSGMTTTIPSPDCIPYNKAGLKIVNEGANGWLLTDGPSRMLMLDTEQDAKNALILAQAHTRQCFIGRDNARPNRRDYIMEYWLA